MSACQAKVSVPFLGRPLFLLCGEPSTAVYDYWCEFGHERRGMATCDAHRPVEGKVGCSQCWPGREAPMMFGAAHRKHDAEHDAGGSE